MSKLSKLTTPSRCVVLITAADIKEGRKIAGTLLEKKLAACVNIVPKIESQYWWKGHIEKANETFLIAKSRHSLIRSLIKKVKQIHSYSVPEVIVLDIRQGNPDYLKWLDSTTRA